MSGATIFDLPTVPRLQTLLQNVADGTILIPRFQRPFLWSDEQRFLLLDSVLKGLPIGSLMVWRTTKHRLECYEDLPPFHLSVPPAEARNGVQTYLIDGLQRLTTLFGALRATDTEGDDPNAETRWPIYLDLQASDRTFKLPPRRKGWKAPDTWLPLSMLFDPTALWDFQQRLMEFDPKARNRAESRELARKAELIATRVKDYTVPVIPIHTDDLDLATESFQRVNSEGTRMNERHMLVALTFARDWDVDRGLRAVTQRLDEAGWASLDESVLLDALKSYFGIDVQKRAVRELCDKLSKAPEAFKHLAEASVRAVRFLSERCGIKGPSSLAYSDQLVSLIDLAMLDKNLEGHAEELVQWIRATTYSGYFAGMNTKQLRRAIEHARHLATQGSETNVLPDDLVRTVGPLRRFNYNSARTRAFVWTLLDRSPLDTAGHPLLAARAVGLHGNDALDLIVPSVEGALPANRMVTGDSDVPALRRVLRDPSDLLHAKVCASHFIDEAAAKALVSRDYDRFFTLRAAAIWAAEETKIRACGLTPDPDV